jgi:hypothetical protein
MIAMMSIVVYIPPVVESIRADRAYTSDELATDINRINEIVARLEQDRIPDVWKPDTLIRIDKNRYPYSPDDITYQEGREYLDSSTFNYRIREADSLRIINEGIVITYDFMDLRFINDDRVNRYAMVHVKSNKEIYDQDYKNTRPLPASAKTELQNLIDKYLTRGWENDYYYEQNQQDPWYVINEKYRLGTVDLGIHYIASRKYRLKEIDYADYIRGTYYVTLILTLLIFIFRHSTIKTFFLSLLVGIVLAILTGLFVAMTNLREAGIFALILFYYAAFMIISMLIFSAKKRSVVTGIALNAVVMMTAFIPMICVAIYYTFHRHEYYYEPNMYDSAYYLNMKLHYTISEFAGGILLLILIETLFKRLYRLWYAAPED